MSTFPNSPRLMKGALIGLDPFNPLASVTVFQYNPENLSRTLTPQTAGGEGGGSSSPGEAARIAGPPQETIKLEMILNATDQLEKGGGTLGLHPQLASLEMMLYPKSSLVIANEILLRTGVIEVIPPEVPLAVLVWGVARILPVRLTELSVTEELHDPNLNPIHAKVSLGLRVLNYRDLGLLSPGGALFMAHQIAKEVMATANSVGGAISVAASVKL